MSDRAPYSRVYWSIRDDAKFDGIRADDHHLATWLRLLIAADMAYPASADLPATARKASVNALVDAGLVDLLPDGLFRIRGLQAERERRSWDRKGPIKDLDRDQIGTQPSLAKPSLDETETSQAEQPRADAADSYYRLTGRFPSKPSLDWLDQLQEQFGGERVATSLGVCYSEDPSLKTLLGRVQDRLKSTERMLEQAERAQEQARLKAKRKRDPLYDEIKAAIVGRYGEDVA